jgi:hypothetical protein
VLSHPIDRQVWNGNTVRAKLAEHGDAILDISDLLATIPGGW